MKARIAIALVLTTASLAALFPAAPARAAAPAPAWDLSAFPSPDNVAPGSNGQFVAMAINIGAADTAGSKEVQLALPPGIVPLRASAFDSDQRATNQEVACTLGSGLLVCQTAEPIGPGRRLEVNLFFEVPAATPEGGELEAQATVAGGGAPQGATATATALVSSMPLPFGFTLPLRAPAVQADGSPAALAGSHPYQQNLDFGFPVLANKNASERDNSGHPHEIRSELPRGMVVDPAATPELCTEAQLVGSEGCPPSSQVGFIDLTTTALSSDLTSEDPLYNMVPPPGHPAMLGFDAAAAGLPAHLLGALRSESDFGIESITPDILSFGRNPVFDIHAQLWGDPSSPAHDNARCVKVSGSCPVEAQKTAFLTTPGDCAGRPLSFEVAADSWEQPGSFARSAYESADLEGSPYSLGGCGQLEYQPTISSVPTTNLADVPSGLDFTLRQPTGLGLGPEGEGRYATRAAAELKDARVTLPAGMSVNPSQADGLGACTETEIGYLAEDEEVGIHFSNAANSCPDASRLGTVEVESPLLAQYKNEGTELETDPETGEPIPRPLDGSVYLAKPYANPFGSLLAIYLAVEDPRSGIVAKLAGRVEADPGTGRLTTVFEENPELPLSDIHLSLFGGARGSLITPISCGAHSTTTTLTPWSAPEGADAHPSDSFQTTQEPGGGACPSSEAGASNSPSFEAGTLTPQAGAYSPFVLKLHREDGSQRLVGVDTTLPPGLSGKLAGIAECSETQMAQARSREAPNLGQAEKQSPSCPGSSEVGIVKVAAGAGPNPFWTQGHAYLAGPYKGAPLSLAVIVPAVAGPFDLGAVVSRVALHVDLETAQIHAVSDPFPTILEGIPLDLRTVVLEMGRPGFTLNPTSCDPMSVLGTATSSLGSAASLSSPFQVGGCQSLAFKPHLKISLSGGTRRSGHPALKAVLTMPPGGANIASAQVGLPHALFIDQGNLNKVCTQPELRSRTCPASSVYGHARAISPLLDAPLEGPVYLGVGYGHQLPDLVADLNGQIRVLLHGKVDTTKQDGIRNTFEVVPDAPVSKFTLSLKGGKKYGLIENSESLCAKPQKASVLFAAQNGRVDHFASKLAVKCRGHKHGRRHTRRR